MTHPCTLQLYLILDLDSSLESALVDLDSDLDKSWTMVDDWAQTLCDYYAMQCIAPTTLSHGIPARLSVNIRYCVKTA